MREKKRRRLEAKGWKLGTAQEFLGLSDEESSRVDLEARRAESQRDLRRRGGLAAGSADRRDL